MKVSFRTVILLLVLLVLFGTSVLVASAAASTHVVTTFIGCDHISASGTSTALYVTLYAINDDTWEEYFVTTPVTGGSFSATITYPEAPAGTPFDVEIWGSDSAGTSDGTSTFLTAAACIPPSTCSNPLPSDSVVYQVPLGAPTFYAASLDTKTNFDLPAGTWKISEFSGDFAKVWISCEGSPVWIPKNAVGSAIG